jgi:hypothetical protein
MSYAVYTKQYNDFLRRSRENMTADVQCVRFINGMANFTLKNQAKSHRAQKGYQVTLVELQNFLNDVVTDSPELGNMRSSVGPSIQPTRKRNFDDPLVEASKNREAQWWWPWSWPWTWTWRQSRWWPWSNIFKHWPR